MNQWEYKVVSASEHYRRDSQIRLFREMGKEGWEFVGQIGEKVSEAQIDLSWVFKRKEVTNRNKNS